MKTKTIITGIILFLGAISFAQAPHDSELYLQLKKADSLLFEVGFNNCDLKTMEEIVHKDLEFLHDQGGIQNRAEFFASIRKNICPESGPKPYRKLVPNTLEVYPLYANGKLYGAIQMGQHAFYRYDENKKLKMTSVAKFTDTWLLENGQWKLYHVLSYDHQNPKE